MVSALTGVSCSSPKACTAVGTAQFQYSGPVVTVAEHWNGTNWTIEPTPEPELNHLAAVSCTSATACTAVGDRDIKGRAPLTVAERWDGTSWTVQATRDPAANFSSGLSGVSCISATACFAVGSYTNTSDVRTLAERWDGVRWAIQPMPSPSTGNQLSAVSCASARWCTAVGSSNSGTLAERWNGKRWAVQAVPKRLAPPADVSCTSARACTAVGTYRNKAGTLTLAERWNGIRWSAQSSANPALNQDSGLSGVSCTTSISCESSGWTLPTFQPLAERWDGRAWAMQSPADEWGTLRGVSCSSAKACAAVGFEDAVGRNPASPLAERWDGSHWTAEPVPRPGIAQGTYLFGVSCTSGHMCIAVGDYFYNEQGDDGCSDGICLALAERWDGTRWSLQAMPNPAGTTQVDLWGVSCASPTACTAVGSYTDAANQSLPLAERWNGKTWSIQPSVVPSGAHNGTLWSVSCTSGRACTAVGNYWNGSSVTVTLVERWDGARWSVQPTPNPAGAKNSYLRGVSCASGKACMAVGSYTDSAGISVALAEHWAGKKWSLQPTAQPAGAHGSNLWGVSCLSAKACTATGSYDDGINTLTLVERYS